jgi:HEPN domain-containing protein
MTKTGKPKEQKPSPEIIGEWVQKAESDFTSIEILVKSAGYPRDVVCYHCQQCAEKYLKAYLTQHAVRFPWTHNLRELQDLALPLDSDFQRLGNDLALIEEYALDVRYPGRLPILEEAQDSRETILRVRVFMRQKLGLDKPADAQPELPSTDSE